MSMMDAAGLDAAMLSPKQREVLDLLLQHKTAKEMARDLGISPHTVEQRLRTAREKLGVTRRSELVAAYRRQNAIYEKTVYGPSRIVPGAMALSKSAGPEEQALILAEPAQSAGSTAEEGQVLLVPAIMTGPAKGLIRVGAVFVIAASAITVALTGMAMFQQLSTLMH